MDLTKNKWYRVFGVLLLVLGIVLVAKAFAAEGHPVGAIPWLNMGPVGLMCFISGIGLLFLPAKIKF